MQKTFTVDCFTHRAIKNTGQKPQYRLRNHHPPIISRKDWETVQALLHTPRQHVKYAQPPPAEAFYVQRIKSGNLKGFVVIDSKWRAKDLDLLFLKLNLTNER